MSAKLPRRADQDQHPVSLGHGLFRSEVLAEQQGQWLGPVLLTPRISHAALAMVSTLIAAALVLLICTAHFTRTARVSGWLVPVHGVVQVVAPESGVVVRLQAQEGEAVRKGDSLLLLSAEQRSEALGATHEFVLRELRSRRSSLRAAKARQRDLQRSQGAELARRLKTNEQQQVSLQKDFTLQHARITLAEDVVKRERGLFARRLAAVTALEQAESDLLQQSLSMQALERQRSTLELEHLALDMQMRELPLRSEDQMAAIDREIAALNQQIAEAEAQRQIVITAPEDGTVTAVQANPGGSVGINQPLFSIIPSDSRLKAQLFAPSRVVGFLAAGQRVLLRYQPFPYQKFGHYEGVITSISRSAVSPATLSPQLAGLTSLYGGNEPVYEINVTLARQTVTAYGRARSLHAGMQLDADVLVERRRLIEWVLDPLFTLTGRWNG